MLHALLREGRVDKRYLTARARAAGPRHVSEIDAPLVTRRVGGEARVKVDAAGKEARSTFRVLDRFGKTASLLEVAIDTGRTHQIRVHAAHAGHPVAGDERYGDEDFNAVSRSRSGCTRMFLHAHSLSFEWPDTGEPFSVSAPLPDDLKAVLTALETKSAKARSGSAPSFLSASATKISGRPISAVGSCDEICSNNATPSPSALKLPAQSSGLSSRTYCSSAAVVETRGT